MPTRGTFWVPSTFENRDYVFIMSATHRGDMYHVRAAMQLQKVSIILHETSGKTTQVQEYLRKSALANGKHTFEVPWSYQILTSRTKPSKYDGVLSDGKDYRDDENLKRVELITYSESEATRFIAQQTTISDDMVNFMAILKPESKTTLNAEFAELYNKTWKITPHKATILAMYRDTGAKGGVYPELDTGDTIQELSKVVEKLPRNPDNTSIRIISCGSKTPIGPIPSLGEYWLQLDSIKPKDETARDVEAYFMLWSFKNGYFQMACGLRSGPFDLFTFMGIPTVSIGLRNMIGEIRHASLAKEEFKRINIQYYQPRHEATAFVKPRKRNPRGIQWALMCPFWDSDPPDNATKRQDAKTDAEKKKLRDKSPGNYRDYDKVVLETAFRIASHRHLGGVETVSFLKTVDTTIIGTEKARYAHPARLTGDKKMEHFVKMHELEKKEIEDRKKADSLQEPREQLSADEVLFRRDWREIFSILDGEEEEY
ncbi:hypothetical protein GGS21DRAFT_526089 [Xylaria nigripes]|nr:hypothetical protein GGS21DRAFT_526089 [Xylaria nigripes]